MFIISRVAAFEKGALRFKLQLLYAAAATRRMSTQSVNIEESVGVIGLGQMGGRMADNLRKNGHKLVVCDPVPANVQRQVDQGAKATANAREVAEQCDTIITMLPSTATVECVYLGEDGVHEALRSEHLLLDSSTIDPIFTKKLSKELHDRGATFVDAPVSGGVAGAQNGTLTSMVGGEPDEFERVKPLLKAMGKNLVHCGGSSTGQIAKLCNNLAAAIQLTSVAEATNLGVALGIDPRVLAAIMNSSTSCCWSSTTNHPYPGILPDIPASKGYEGGFAVQLMRKDLGLASSCATSAEASVPLVNSVLQLFNMMVTQGNGHKDFAYILPFIAE
ncbi:NAD-binding of NADP-dependent 3-hydroxyisobutyrate dehydrogenase [Phytophthora infestans]|uniref:3-hydroxyisobutyrate dehydrogenase n=1 Tax=Phytophthora infestans TaxID=4787 RepID=A0A833T0U7_PHYIN|nr:NAD-binding of NADP-dependent 3-hydroxyisobutyrate dehydrogenase [Phytophthora infestans]KAF4132821.1 NAD-binding of NADP-dependent 3-hydroxyisobutyrate dehydrogenase [Phytophthora infestans]